MTLYTTLKDYFDNTPGAPEKAMYGDLKGFTHWKSDTYQPSEFEKWAEGYGIELESVDSYGGEGEGSTYYHVWKFTGQGEEVYLRFDGYYQSYDGSTYESFRHVQPTTKMVTVYE